MTRRIRTVLIAGAGPAGMLLAYLLARAGVGVRVVERAKSFGRQFRGEFLQPSGLRILADLGLLDDLQAAGAATRMAGARIFVRERLVMRLESPDGAATVSQTKLLERLHDECSRFPDYRLDLGTTVESIHREGDRVIGFDVARGPEKERLIADLVVAANGRRSGLRKAAGLQARTLEADMQVLWVKLHNVPDDLRPEGLSNYVSRGSLCVLYPVQGGTVQIALCRRTRDAAELRVKGESELEELLATALPAAYRGLHGLVDKHTEKQAFKVACDRLERWHVPGMLFIGDAAHTFGAVAGLGVNMALRDAVVAANHIIDAVARDEEFDEAVCHRIQSERAPETEALQDLQVKLTRMHFAPLVVQRIAFAMFPALVALGIAKPGVIQSGTTMVTISRPAERAVTERGGAA